MSNTTPFHDLRLALASSSAVDTSLPVSSDGVRIDPGRRARTGIPEVVFAESKSAMDSASALRRLARVQGRALASRVAVEAVEAVRRELEPEFDVEHVAVARCLIVSVPAAARPTLGGVVGVLSAGSSDIPVAMEAALMAAEMGATVHQAWDVGVAGIHRLVEPLERFAGNGVEAIVVAAGMDGALPAVVAGLIDVPVIGLPTSVGYGFGGGGVGALTSMLQSCAPGLVVVNIDNGIGAGATAALIANRMARSGRRFDGDSRET